MNGITIKDKETAVIFASLSDSDSILADFSHNIIGIGDCLSIGSTLHQFIRKLAPDSMVIFIFAYKGLIFSKDKNVRYLCAEELNKDEFKEFTVKENVKFVFKVFGSEFVDYNAYHIKSLDIRAPMDAIAALVFNTYKHKEASHAAGMNALLSECGFMGDMIFESVFETSNPKFALSCLDLREDIKIIAILEKSVSSGRSVGIDWVASFLKISESCKGFENVKFLIFSPTQERDEWLMENSLLAPFIENNKLILIDKGLTCLSFLKMSGFLHPDVITGAICCDSMGYHMVSGIFRYTKQDLNRIILLLGYFRSHYEEYNAYGGPELINWQNTDKVLPEKGKLAKDIIPERVIEKLLNVIKDNG